MRAQQSPEALKRMNLLRVALDQLRTPGKLRKHPEPRHRCVWSRDQESNRHMRDGAKTQPSKQGPLAADEPDRCRRQHQIWLVERKADGNPRKHGLLSPIQQDGDDKEQGRQRAELPVPDRLEDRRVRRGGQDDKGSMWLQGWRLSRKEPEGEEQNGRRDSGKQRPREQKGKAAHRSQEPRGGWAVVRMQPLHLDALADTGLRCSHVSGRVEQLRPAPLVRQGAGHVQPHIIRRLHATRTVQEARGRHLTAMYQQRHDQQAKRPQRELAG